MLDLVKQKGLYPYEYLTDFEKFKKELPGKEKFYSSLTDRKIMRNIYVWKRTEMKTMKCYRNLYLKSDVLVLVDVFEKFRNNSLKMTDYVQVIT